MKNPAEVIKRPAIIAINMITIRSFINKSGQWNEARDARTKAQALLKDISRLYPSCQGRAVSGKIWNIKKWNLLLQD